MYQWRLYNVERWDTFSAASRIALQIFIAGLGIAYGRDDRGMYG